MNETIIAYFILASGAVLFYVCLVTDVTNKLRYVLSILGWFFAWPVMVIYFVGKALVGYFKTDFRRELKDL